VCSPGDQRTRPACCGRGHVMNRAGRPPAGATLGGCALSEAMILSMPQSLQPGGNPAIGLEAWLIPHNDFANAIPPHRLTGHPANDFAQYCRSRAVARFARISKCRGHLDRCNPVWATHTNLSVPLSAGWQILKIDLRQAVPATLSCAKPCRSHVARRIQWTNDVVGGHNQSSFTRADRPATEIGDAKQNPVKDVSLC
jgi:hypothetical protein